MRIVHVITRFIRGGADENTMLTCNGQVQRGHDVHLIMGDFHPEMRAALDPRVTVHHLTSLRREPTVRDVQCLAQLVGTFRKIRPDVVHTHESKAGVLGRVAGRLGGVPLVVHGVHILPFIGVSRPVAMAYLGLEKLAARYTHAYVSVSDEMRNVCLANGLGTPDMHVVAPSGMDLGRFRHAAPIDRGAILPGIAVPEGRPIALLASALEPRKRVAELIAELGRSDRAVPWTLLISGEGHERDRIERTIDESGLGDRVHLLGFRSDLPNLLASCDFVVHAAANEGLPRVLVQAVLAGRPIASTALPGIERIVTADVSGLLSDVDSIPALAANFIRLASDADQRDRMARHARAQDLSDWDADTMVDRIEAVYASKYPFAARREISAS